MIGAPSLPSLGRLDLAALPQVLPRLVRMAFRYRWRCLGAAGCAAAAAALNVATPKLLGDAVDLAVQHAAVGAALGTAAAWLVAACVARGLATGGMGYLGESVSQRVGFDLRLAYFEKLQRLDFRFHDTHHSGDLIARGMLDLEGTRSFIEMGLLRALLLALMVGAGLWRLLHVDPLLAALALSFVPFVAWRAARMGAMLRLSWQRLQAMMGELTRGMEENLQGVRVVRAFAARGFELLKFDALSDAALRLSNLRITLRMIAVSQMSTAYYAAMGAVLWVGTQRIAAGTLSVGTLTEVLTYMTLLQTPVRQVGMIVNASARAVSSGARLFDVLDREPAIADAPGALTLHAPQGHLRFEHVSFAYSTQAVLHDISFELHPGRTLGIVGAPGSGKSTLVQLIARLHEVSQGRILLDGHDIRHLTLESLRRAVGLVQQEVFLFDTSVHDNAAYASDTVAADTPRTRVAEGVAQAQLHAHVSALPQGYETRVGERGVGLSGGQRQRLAIARGLVSDPAVMIFDDATSAVDTATERALRQALQAAVQHKATIIVAHRLGSVRHADEILVLDRGRVAERGTHEALLRKGGPYAALWALQNTQTRREAAR
ncbi:ABC transporter ATP-binding protein [Roseateles sp.]|uniref:ABC transporter ATP-binding protein n=1 Tax=Roseateles sp. TaxID=1971397 RepID=UPI0039EC0908